MYLYLTEIPLRVNIYKIDSMHANLNKCVENILKRSGKWRER